MEKGNSTTCKPNPMYHRLELKGPLGRFNHLAEKRRNISVYLLDDGLNGERHCKPSPCNVIESAAVDGLVRL